MGTNFYLEIGICQCCERPREKAHIGKSSFGWCFALHIDDEFTSLDDWKAAWNQSASRIVNEYGDKISIDEMTRIIEMRERLNGEPLRRSTIDERHCIGHGADTYDLITGEFS